MKDDCLIFTFTAIAIIFVICSFNIGKAVGRTNGYSEACKDFYKGKLKMEKIEKIEYKWINEKK